jgi:3-phosphoshikimate 1-carboxyvinyltransferase
MITIEAPPSKSLAHRAFIAAALADGTSLLHAGRASEDILCTRRILCAAGAKMEDMPDGAVQVTGTAGQLRGTEDSPPLSCYVHESGTTCRLLTAVLAAGRGRFRIHGAPRMHERPLGGLAAALEALGARLLWEGRRNRPPLILETDGLRGGELDMETDESSQYLSGLLLAAPLCREKLIIRLKGAKAVSWPYAALTLQTLEDFGIPLDVRSAEAAQGAERGNGEEPGAAAWRAFAAAPGKLCFLMRPAAYRARNFTVEGDWSGASYFLAAGAVGDRAVRVTNLKTDSLQGDRALLEILRRMGARVEEGGREARVYPSRLRGIEADMGHCPDLVPTVAALAAFAEGRTMLTGAAHLRIKESDRIAASADNLRAAGIRVEEREDGLNIEGGEPGKASLFRARGDHRIAMSAALLGIRHGRAELDDPSVVRKSFPSFWDLWETLSGQE